MTLEDRQDRWHRYDRRIAELWRHRLTLSPEEWSEFYRILVEILRSVNFKELSSLVDEREDLIQGFFVQVVMQRALNGSTAGCDHAGALIAFFRNYVIDELRARKARNCEVLASDLLGVHSDLDPDRFVESQAEQAKMEDTAPHTPESILKEADYSVDDVLNSAGMFLQNQERWVGLMLAHGFCPDDADRIPLYLLAKRHEIASYHSRAAGLGITRKKTDLPDDYSKTILGRWLSSLTGGTFDVGNLQVYSAMLKILCLAVSIHEVSE